VVDCEHGRVRLRLAEKLAADLGADYLRLGDVTTEPLTAAVTERRIA